MSLTRGAVWQLFDAGEYGRILEAARQSQFDGRLDPSIGALVAYACFEAGATDLARSLALDRTESQKPGVRARAQLVLALCLRASGQVTEARRLHQASIRSAEETDDEDLKAWTALHLLRHSTISAPRNVAAAMIPSVRAQVQRSGSPRATAYLHATVAVGEGQAGRIREAQRHCRLARQFVAAAPHAWLNCSVLGVTAAIALAACDFAEARECLEGLQRVALEHGLAADRLRANVNVGHLAIVTGDYETAERALREVMRSPLTSRIAKLAAADSLARAFLAQDRLSECAELLATIEKEAADNVSLAHVLAVQGALITRSRLLLKSGSAQAAIDLLERLATHGRETLARPLMAAAHMTAAQAFAANGQAAVAAKHLAISLSMNPVSLPELQGQFYYAAASTLDGADDALARSLRHRARRLWALQGTTALEREFVQHADTPPTGQGSFGSPPTQAVIVDSLSNLLALGATPTLLIQEVQHSIRLLDCSSDIRLVSVDQNTDRPSGAMELLVPQTDSKPLKLVCSVPESPQRALTLGAIIRVGELALELERLREAERRRLALWPERSAEAAAGVIFESDKMREVLTIARRIADTTVPVLITGETGTGKEVVARLIHSYSRRSKSVFLPFNCTSASRDMIESQLFGHRKGSFTGATEHHPGVVRAADHGTLLLDEIGDMHLDVQPRLLRFLESDEIHPVGAPQPLKVDVRVIAATNADLKSLVAKGEFREDLYYRLSIVPIHLSPLRERRGEIPSLALHYLDRYAREFRKGDMRLAEEAVDYLVLFRWPGNVRQLANEMRRVAVMAEPGAVVMPQHLDSEIVSSGKALPPRSEQRANEIGVRLDQPIAAAVEHVERAMVAYALAKTEGLLEPAAEMLGLSRKGLYLKRQRYHVEGLPSAERLQASGLDRDDR